MIKDLGFTTDNSMLLNGHGFSLTKESIVYQTSVPILSGENPDG